MNKIKTITICLVIPFFVLTAIMLLKIKSRGEYQQKTALALEMRKALKSLMLDLREAREDSILDVPADGEWHHRIAFDHAQQGALEYAIKDRHLWRIHNHQIFMVADNIGDLRIRRQKDTPDILEVQIEAQKNVTLISNLKIRIR